MLKCHHFGEIMKTIILDFVGVVADINYKKLIWSLPLKEKFSSLRIFLSLKRYPNLKYSFYCYQMGLSTLCELEQDIAEFLPHSAYVIPELLKNFHKYITVNEQVLYLVEKLKQKGIQVLLMSNSIPETEKAMNKHDLKSVFNGIILSHHLKMMKPQKKMYEYAIKTHALIPEETLMIDDTKKNLIAANEVGFKTIQCKKSEKTYVILQDYLDYLETTNQA